MKAAVLAKEGTVPKYAEFPDPIPQNDNEVIINVKAATITQLDLLKSSGSIIHIFPFSLLLSGSMASVSLKMAGLYMPQALPG